MKLLRPLGAFAALVLLVAPGLTAQAAPARLELLQDRISLKVGESAQIRTRILDANGNELDSPLMFFARPADGTDARLDVGRTTGEVNAVSGGDWTVIVLSAENRDLRTEVPVSVAYPAIARVAVAPGSGGSFYVGSAVRHTATVVDGAGDVRKNLPLTWATSDAAVASVDRFGVLTAHKAGRVTLTASAGSVDGRVRYDVRANPVTSIMMSASQDVGRTGDVIRFEASPMAGDTKVADIPVTYSLVSYPAREATADIAPAEIDARGRFVAYKPGVYTVTASVPGHSATRTVEISPRHVVEEVTFTGHSAVRNVRTSDLWIWQGVDGRDYAVTGTWGAFGAVYFHDVTDPANPILTDSVVVDARTTNDVKVSEDGSVCVTSREGASNRRNGIVILDCRDPYDIEILSTFDDGLTGGVHNVFVADGYVYAVNNGTRFDVIDIKDPRSPHRVGQFELNTPGHAIHDVWVMNGVAYTSNWDDGVVVVDVGGGNKGGSPANPVLMYKYTDIGGATHAAFPYRSPTGRFYIFMGDEIGRPGFDGQVADRTPEFMAGFVHIVDFTDPEHPEEVARYEVPEAGSHNLWIDDDKMYVAFYNGGVRVVDISGEMKGNLFNQGREIARYLAYDPDGYVANAPFTWGPQPYKGNLFFAEHFSGLWAVKLQPSRGLIP